jgi:hypothetical protein
MSERRSLQNLSAIEGHARRSANLILHTHAYNGTLAFVRSSTCLERPNRAR